MIPQRAILLTAKASEERKIEPILLRERILSRITAMGNLFLARNSSVEILARSWIVFLVLVIRQKKEGKLPTSHLLQPVTVASIKTWRNSRGAGRIGLTRLQSYKIFLRLASFFDKIFLG